MLRSTEIQHIRVNKLEINQKEAAKLCGISIAYYRNHELAATDEAVPLPVLMAMRVAATQWQRIKSLKDKPKKFSARSEALQELSTARAEIDKAIRKIDKAIEKIMQIK